MIVPYARFIHYQRLKLQSNARRTPHQLARETLMKSDGYKVISLASNGYSMMTKPADDDDVALYAIHKDGSVHYMGTWPEDSIHVK